MPDVAPLRIGIIGCGIVARKHHLPAIQHLGTRFVVTAVCNHNIAKADTLADDVTTGSVARYSDYTVMLKEADIDCVAVLLPVELNYVVCSAAAAAGKHILVEKPIAQDVDTARKMVALAEAHPQLTMLGGENYRYKGIYPALRRHLLSGSIGTPYHIEMKVWCCMDLSNPYAQTLWRQQHTYEGGFITDSGVHNVAALREVFGSINHIASHTSSVNPAIGRTDTMTVLFETNDEDGGLPSLPGTLNMAFSVHGVAARTLTVLGTEGSIVVDAPAGEVGDVMEETKDTRLSVFGGVPGEATLVERYTAGSFCAQYEDFHAAIREQRPPKSTFAKLLGDLDVILGAVQKGMKKQ